MQVDVQRVEYAEVESLSGAYRHEANCQIIHDSALRRQLADPWLIRVDGMLAGYGGMLSLAQLTIAGIAAYTVAIFGHNSVGVMGLGWPWWIAAPFAIALAAVSAALIGLIAVRSVGI